MLQEIRSSVWFDKVNPLIHLTLVESSTWKRLLSHVDLADCFMFLGYYPSHWRELLYLPPLNLLVLGLEARILPILGLHVQSNQRILGSCTLLVFNSWGSHPCRLANCRSPPLSKGAASDSFPISITVLVEFLDTVIMYLRHSFSVAIRNLTLSISTHQVHIWVRTGRLTALIRENFRACT